MYRQTEFEILFFPGVGNFFMQGFNQYVHKLIIFEEFCIEYYPLSMLKRLLEGREYTYPVKCCPDQVFKYVGPVIFVSNVSVEGCKDNAFLSRLKVVHADRFVEDGTLSEIVEIKKEPVQTSLNCSFISISSTDPVSE